MCYSYKIILIVFFFIDWILSQIFFSYCKPNVSMYMYQSRFICADKNALCRWLLICAGPEFLVSLQTSWSLSNYILNFRWICSVFFRGKLTSIVLKSKRMKVKQKASRQELLLFYFVYATCVHLAYI